MLKKLKQFFFGTEKKPPVELSIETLDGWFEEQSKPLLSHLEEQREDFNNKLADEKVLLKARLKTLASASLMNDKIPEKEKHYMVGNRESYIRRVEGLIEELSPLPSLDKFDDFFLSYSQLFSDFSSQSKKSFMILQHFFKNEVQGIAIRLKELDGLHQNFRERLAQSHLNTINALGHSISELKKSIVFENDLDDEITGAVKKEEKLKEKKKTLLGEQEKLKSSELYRGYEELKNRIAKNTEEIKLHRASLDAVFSTLDRPLRKFIHKNVVHKKIVEQYLEDPFSALMKDVTFEIATALAALKNALSEGKVDLKDGQQERLLFELAQYERSYFSGFLKQYGKLKEKEEELLGQLKDLTIRGEVKKVEDALKQVEGELGEVTSQREELQRQLDKIDIEHMKKDIVDDVAFLLNVELDLK